MSRERHVYRPPRGRFSGIAAIIGGVAATLLVFVLIPLSQKLAEMTSPPIIAMPEPEATPPPELELIEEEPPPEEELEEPPEPPIEEPMNLDMALDIDLSVGTGGGILVNIPKDFNVRGGDDPFGSGDLDSPPQPTNRLPPTYPSGALRDKRGGKVLVRCTVNENGRVVGAKVKTSSGHRDLDEAALKAVNRWKFKPAIRGGKKVVATCVVPFNFEVK